MKQLNKIMITTALLFIPFGLVASSILTPMPIKNTQHAIMQSFADKLLNSSKKLSAVSLASQCKQYRPSYAYAGTLRLKGSTPVNQNSLFEVGSITKSFVSVVILQLLQEKHISLNTPIGNYFPQYKRWGKITIKQLLNMTSGIPGNGTVKPTDIFRKFTAKQYHNYIPPTKILNLTYKLPLDFKPGSKFEYSNTNYTLLGVLIGKLGPQDGYAAVDARIIKKLGLQHTYFVKDKLADIPGVNTKNVVHGYDFYRKDSKPYPFQKYGEDVTAYSLSPFNYSGAIVSTPAEINRYIHALYTPGVLLDAKQFKQLTSLTSTANGKSFNPKKQPDQIGFGLGIFGMYNSDQKQMIYFYQGQTNGYQFMYLYAPKTQMYLSFGINTIWRGILNMKNTFGLFDKLNKTCE
ncbi:MAG: serine hydrolase [Coxiellaceae bacterium]|nr:serine hydrolase [Coxiellaceae bacterium]